MLWATANFDHLCKASRYRSTTLVLSPSRLSLAWSCTRRGKHNVNEHINVLYIPTRVGVQFFHGARSTAITRMPNGIRKNCSNSRPNGDWIADKAVLFFPPERTARRPLIFCDWWNSSMVDNFAFNKRQSSISERVIVSRRKSTSAFVTGNFLLREDSARWIERWILPLCIFKELSYAAKCTCTYTYTCARLSMRAQYQCRYRSTEGRLNRPTCELLRSYLCSHTSSLLMHSPQIESGIDRKSCLLLYARVTTWFPRRRRRWSPTSNCDVKGWSRIF